MTIPRWEHFYHEADIGVRGFGADLAQAFSQTALAMIAVITDPALVESQESVDVHCHAPDDEILLVDWLNAIVYEIATRGMLFSRFDINVENHTLDATLWGERINVEKHHPTVEVKGATFTALKVQQKEDECMAQCIVDV
jgi:SHS2 domain-containing protein